MSDSDMEYTKPMMISIQDAVSGSSTNLSIIISHDAISCVMLYDKAYKCINMIICPKSTWWQQLGNGIWLSQIFLTCSHAQWTFWDVVNPAMTVSVLVLIESITSFYWYKALSIPGLMKILSQTHNNIYVGVLQVYVQWKLVMNQSVLLKAGTVPLWKP